FERGVDLGQLAPRGLGEIRDAADGSTRRRDPTFPEQRPPAPEQHPAGRSSQIAIGHVEASSLPLPIEGAHRKSGKKAARCRQMGVMSYITEALARSRF